MSGVGYVGKVGLGSWERFPLSSGNRKRSERGGSRARLSSWWSPIGMDRGGVGGRKMSIVQVVAGPPRKSQGQPYIQKEKKADVIQILAESVETVISHVENHQNVPNFLPFPLYLLVFEVWLITVNHNTDCTVICIGIHICTTLPNAARKVH